MYVKQGDFSSAAIVLDERALTSGPTTDIISALRDVYSRLPEGNCAFKSDGAEAGLNSECPGVLKRRCSALSELKQVFADARAPEMASHFTELAGQQSCTFISANQ